RPQAARQATADAYHHPHDVYRRGNLQPRDGPRVTGFVLKENAVADILNGIAAVAKGEHYLSPSISGYLVRRRSRAESLAARQPGLEDLTKAELRILKLIADKKTSREIAAELFISPRTVEAHRANISTKLELRGSHSLLHFALENRAAL